jgi:phage tail tape-measure protein
MLTIVFSIIGGAIGGALAIWLTVRKDRTELLRIEKETKEQKERVLEELRKRTEAEIRASIR